MATRCDILVDGLPEMSLAITEGNVTVDDVAIRRRATVSLTDPTGDLMPVTAFDLLMPGRNELQLWRGLYIPGEDEPELLSLGIFGISDLQIEDSGQGLHINIEGFDRARKLSKNRLPEDYHILAGTLTTTAIQNLCTEAYGAINFMSHGETDYTPNIIIEQGEDPWEQAQKLAASIGCDLYFDAFGDCICEPMRPDLDMDEIDWTYGESEIVDGREDGTLLYLSKRVSDEGVYSRVVATGETTSNEMPVRGEASDQDPLSPTYIDGPFGPVTYFMASSFITTHEQAVAAAQRQLAKSVGFFERIETITIVHPAHEIGDVIKIHRPKNKIDALYSIDKITIPMVHSRGMNISTRSRRLELGMHGEDM